MSLQVLVVHSGEKLLAEPTAFTTLDSFRSWLTGVSNVPPQYQILLLPNGKQAKLQSLSAEVSDHGQTMQLSHSSQSPLMPSSQVEIFLYNRQLLFSPPDTERTSSKTPFNQDAPRIAVNAPPDTITNQNDLASWRSLFRARRDWALKHVEKVRGVAKAIQGHIDALRIMDRGVGVAVGNLESHVTTLEQRYNEARDWADGLHQEQSKLLGSIDDSRQHLASLPCDPAFVNLLPLLNGRADIPRSSMSDGIVTLDHLINEKRLKTATETVEMDLSAFSQRIEAQGRRVESVVADANKLFDDVDSTKATPVVQIESDASQLMEEIEVVAKKICSDCEHVLELGSGQKSLSQASKLALMHTRNYLPSIKDYCEEMGDIAKKVIEQRIAVTSRTTQNMQQVASVEATFAEVDAEVKAMDFESNNDDAFALVSLITQLPTVYGAILLESIRRREWANMLRSESAHLTEEVASYREEEETRRKKWAKIVGDMVADDTVVGTSLRLSVKIEVEEDEWPNVSRDRMVEYIDALRKLDGLAPIVDDLEANLRDLDPHLQRQIKVVKASDSDSAGGNHHTPDSLVYQDNDELRALREANSKLEDDVKGQKSRVRKLEDLLYKQSQPKRTMSSNLFHNPVTPPRESTTPEAGSPNTTHNDSLSRKAPTASRRTSANLVGEDKTFARRIVSLEADLHAERQKRQQVEKAASNRHEKTEETIVQLEESKSTTRDLMANLDAQQREFLGERRLLEERMSKHKSRVEELEDELDRILGSHDNSRLLIEERTRSLDRELAQANDALASAREDAKQRDEAQEEHARTLRGVHGCLAPEKTVPPTTAEIINSLEELAERILRQMRDLTQSVTATKSEKEALQTQLDCKDRDSTSLRQTVQSMEENMTTLRTELSAQHARATSLTTELDDGRQQLKSLRAKFAEGETGSEALRQRVEEQAARASTLASQLAESKSHVNSLDVALSSLQRKHNAMSTAAGTTSDMLERRSLKARELTQRILNCYQELPRLLEALGLSPMRRDGAMIVQRSSKIASQSTTLPDIRGSVSGLAAAEPFDTTIEPQMLTWSQAATTDEEEQRFKDLLAKIDEFNLNTFSEAIIKLRRDVEWTGKKWKMEARGYRDKHLRSQNEAHDKIAVRGFKEGDLALFLPTRNQATKPWAAFNLGAPHYFLREQETHNLRTRDWLVARIVKIEERVVDLSKTLTESTRAADQRSLGEVSEGTTSMDDDNPFELSDGLRWYLLDASEDKSGAPSTPGLGKTTVASANVDVKGSIRMKKTSAGNDASTKLNKSLDSRRSSSNSKRGSISGPAGGRDILEAAGNSNPVLTEGLEVPTKKTSATHLRPGSRSSATSGPSGLGVEVLQAENDEARPSGATDERVLLNQALLNAQVAASPPKGLLGLFGSPPKTWLWHGNSLTRPAETPKPLPKPSAATSSPSKQMELNTPKPPDGTLLVTPTSSPAKARSHPSATRASHLSAQASSSNEQSPSKSPTRSRSTPAWASLYSLDLSLEEKGGKVCGKPT